MIGEPGLTIYPKSEIIARGVNIRNILPTDDPNRLWDISVKAMQAIDPRFPKTKNQTHIDFDDPLNFYKKEHKGDFLVAEVDGNIVGFGGFVERPEIGSSVCEIVRLRVDPDYQKMGIGQKLVNEAEKRAISMGFTRSYITTTNYNKAVLELMKKNGYVITKEQPIPESNFGTELIVYTLEKDLTNHRKVE